MTETSKPVRYKVCGDLPFAGEHPGAIVYVDQYDVDMYGRHLVNGERVLLTAAVAAGTLEPQSKAATEAASVEPAQQAGANPDAVEFRG